MSERGKIIITVAAGNFSHEYSWRAVFRAENAVAARYLFLTIKSSRCVSVLPVWPALLVYLAAYLQPAPTQQPRSRWSGRDTSTR